MKTLDQIEIGSSARIIEVGGSGALRQHFLDMGIVPGAEFTVKKLAPMGDPMEIEIHGYELTLRLQEGEKIKVEPIKERTRKHVSIERVKDSDHPGLGEEGKYHNEEDDLKKLPDDELISFALVGNQNCGKTTLFPRCYC